jgi:hypothetical protein
MNDYRTNSMSEMPIAALKKAVLTHASLQPGMMVYALGCCRCEVLQWWSPFLVAAAKVELLRSGGQTLGRWFNQELVVSRQYMSSGRNVLVE